MDIDKNRIMVYYFESDFMEEYSFTGKVKTNIDECLEIDFSTIQL